MIQYDNPKAFTLKPHIPMQINREVPFNYLYYGIELELEARYPQYSGITKEEYEDFKDIYIYNLNHNVLTYNRKQLNEMVGTVRVIATHTLNENQMYVYNSYRIFKRKKHLNQLSDEIIKLYGDSENKFHCKWEGCVHYGFELVTQPMNFALQKALFHKMKDYLNEKFLSESESEDRNVDIGLHIHINNSYLSEEDKMKLAIFMNRQNDIVYAVGRRGDTDWSSRYDITRAMVEDNDYMGDYGYRGSRTAFRNNYSSTLELRCFKSTNNWLDIMVTLQFIRSIIEFERNFKPIEMYELGYKQEQSSYLEFLGSEKCPCNRQYLNPYLREHRFNIPN